MNTEQQLRERAEAMFNSRYRGFTIPLVSGTVKAIIESDFLDAMIDFHKQELQRIGEVYVPVSVGIETFPKGTGYYFTIQQEDAHGEASIFVSYFDGSEFEMPRYCAQPTHWLKKLSLSNVGEDKQSDNNQ